MLVQYLGAGPVGHLVEMLGELRQVGRALLVLLLRPDQHLWDLHLKQVKVQIFISIYSNYLLNFYIFKQKIQINTSGISTDFSSRC